MSILEEKLPYLEPLKLGHGSHKAPNNGLVNACVMEAVSYIAGEPWSDRPKCASAVITSLMIGLNDRWGDEDRQLLKPYIVRLVGTNTGLEDEERRRWMMTDWLIHEYAPACFRAVGATEQAEAFEALVRVTDRETWMAGRKAIYAVRDEMWKKRPAAAADAAAAAAAAADPAAVAVAVAAAAADADAAAAAAPAAVADAVAAADAAAAADPAADAAAAPAPAAAAVAVADAAAAAAAAAVAAAAADADADADGAYKKVLANAVKAAADEKAKGRSYRAQRDAAYRVFRPYYDQVWRERFVGLGLRESVLGLVDRLIDLPVAA